MLLKYSSLTEGMLLISHMADLRDAYINKGYRMLVRDTDPNDNKDTILSQLSKTVITDKIVLALVIPVYS